MSAEFEKRVSLPAQVSSTGRITLTSSLDPVSPSDPDLAQCAALSWQVDVDLHRPRLEPMPLHMPFGRGFDGHALVPTDDERYETWVRSSRSGITFDSRKYDFVPAGAIGDQRLARPRLQRLDLGAWIDGLARQGGRRTEPSDAGTRADLLAGLWGGRAALAQAFSGPFRDLVGRFSQTGDSTSEAYPENDGVLLPGSMGVLKYVGLSAPWDGAPGGGPPDPRRPRHARHRQERISAAVLGMPQPRLHRRRRAREHEHLHAVRERHTIATRGLAPAGLRPRVVLRTPSDRA